MRVMIVWIFSMYILFFFAEKEICRKKNAEKNDCIKYFICIDQNNIQKKTKNREKKEKER